MRQVLAFDRPGRGLRVEAVQEAHPVERREVILGCVPVLLRVVEGVPGKRDSIHHHLLEVIFETATVPESRQKLLYTTPSGWWWRIESVFRVPELQRLPDRGRLEELRVKPLGGIINNVDSKSTSDSNSSNTDN